MLLPQVPHEVGHYNKWNGSVGDACLDEWDFKTCRSERGLGAFKTQQFSTCRQAERKRWRQGSPHPREMRSPEETVVRKWISGVNGEDARREASETKWEVQLRVWREGAGNNRRTFQINTRINRKKKRWYTNNDRRWTLLDWLYNIRTIQSVRYI